MSNLFTYQLQFGYYVRELNHNHPNAKPFPTGLSTRQDDIGFAIKTSYLYSNNNYKDTIKYNIYLNDELLTKIPFSAKSVIEDFPAAK